MQEDNCCLLSQERYHIGTRWIFRVYCRYPPSNEPRRNGFVRGISGGSNALFQLYLEFVLDSADPA